MLVREKKCIMYESVSGDIESWELEKKGGQMGVEGDKAGAPLSLSLSAIQIT